VQLPSGSMHIDSPAWPLLMAKIAYQGVTTAAGNAFGTTVVCAGCTTVGNQPSYVGKRLKILGGPSAGQDSEIKIHALATGIMTVDTAYSNPAGAVQQIAGGLPFVILTGGPGGGTPAPPSPSIGLWMFGVCGPAMVASTTVLNMPNLAGFPDDIFNTEFWLQVIHNVNAPGTAPEREIRRIVDYVGATGTFTIDALSANVEANDLVCVFHESIMGMEILGFGTITISSATIPTDANRTGLCPWENNDYFKGCLLMPTEGNCRFQPRPIQSYVAATGVFTLAEPFSQAPGMVDYVIIRFAYPVAAHITINLISALVNATLVLKETGGTLTADGTEQVLVIADPPMGNFKPTKIKVDCTNMAWGDSIILRWYERITGAPGAWIKKDELQLDDVQVPPLKNIELEPNRHGIKVTLQQIAGVNRNYLWEYLWED